MASRNSQSAKRQRLADDVTRRKSSALAVDLVKHVACRRIEIIVNFPREIARFLYRRREIDLLPENDTNTNSNDQDQPATHFLDTDVSNPLLETPNGFLAARSSSQPVFIGEASCVAFGDTLLQCVDKDADQPSWPPPTYFQHDIFNRLVRPDVTLPDRIHSRLLVEIAIRFIGFDYHLVLKKSFFDTLDRMCAGEVAPSLAWMCKFHVLLALGEMYSNRKRRTSDQHIPGTDYFLGAVGLLQDLYENPSVEQVEVMILFSFYANALGRVKSSYTYSGIALRIALGLGLHRTLPTDSLLTPVEREHRKRLWWTLYTLDRLCTSNLGFPVLVSDSVIDVELPTNEGLDDAELEEFSDPAHLIANVKLARITGQILNDIYCLPQRTQETFVQRVHRILLSLRKWDEELPQVLRLKQEHIPRNVVSLHLHYNQCVISTTRPILLYLFKNRFSLGGPPGNPPRLFSPTTLALAESCVQAARASNTLLSKLFIEGSLASFGYFDAHYIFSSTLILIMSAVMDPNVGMSDAVSYAFTILRAMKEDGNLPSCDYYERLQRTRASVGKMREATIAGSRIPACLNGDENLENDVPREAEGLRLGFNDGVPLDHPLIDSFLADKGFVWSDGMLPEDHTLRDLACELGDEFLFGPQ
ncbi:hypothetical protein N7493_000547 [Penicillium malachiteum]|uniref:Xylanolytic transcriptional activator regulatory domain-containing protein n=1 Tax=Penicillium malachiteum TaxID=1324776 RepID=A0AAD6HWN4_9EURO|nr:hypothetical protein N7493_000547 [Penicillium malachiteum]